MVKRGKKYKKLLELLGEKVNQPHSLEESVALARQASYARFDETFSVAVKLGIHADKSQHAVRGSVILPASFKGEVKVIAFARDDQAEVAKKAGACRVGTEDLVDDIKKGFSDFDFVVATPDMMSLVGKVAQKLSRRGIFPNKNNHTVALNLESIIHDLRSGLSFFKNAKDAQVNFTVGKKSQADSDVVANIVAFFKQLKAARPASLKGVFVKHASLSLTMGLGFSLNVTDIMK
jgi:large subunit ribosomal protein L1